MPQTIQRENAISLLFNDTSKTIADLKSREWSATTLAVAAILFIDKVQHDSIDSTHPHKFLIGFMVFILVAYGLVLWRCESNLGTFRHRLKLLIRDGFPEEAQRFVQKKDGKDKDEETDELKAASVDEGTIVWTAIVLVVLACGVGIVDVCWLTLFG